MKVITMSSHAVYLEKGRQLITLYQAGLELKRMQIKRSNPNLSNGEVEIQLKKLLARPLPQGIESWGKITWINPHSPHYSMMSGTIK